MSGTATPSVHPTRRSSTALLAVAIVTTSLVVGLGSVIVWNLYESTYAGAAPSAVTTFDRSAVPLHVGIARSPGGPGEWITFAKVFAQLQQDLNRPVVVHYALTSADQIRMFERGELDVALMSTLAYLDVRAEGIVSIAAVPVVLNQPTDVAVLVVPAKSAVRRIEDLRGKRYAVSADLAGVSYAYWLLRQHDLNPDGFFSATPVDVQDVNLTKVAKGQADATSVRRSALAMWPAGVFREIEASPGLGSPPIVVRTSLDSATAEKIRASLTGPAARSAIPTGSVITGFRTADDDEYAFARVLDSIDRRAERKAFGSEHQ